MSNSIDEAMLLLDKALKYYVNKFTVWNVQNDFYVFEIVYKYNISYLSEWFHRKGFDILQAIEEADVTYSDKLKDDMEFQMMALRLNLNTDNREHCFASITNYIVSLYRIIVETHDSTMSFQEFSERYTEEYVEELCECNVAMSPPCDFCAGEENDKIENAYEEYLLNKGGTSQ